MEIPFGMLFEEQISNSPSFDGVIYDPIEQISFCRTDENARTPFITFGLISTGATSTGIVTRSEVDTPDTDPDIPYPSPS